MEHVTPPGGAAPILIPFVSAEDYDNDDFGTYPRRKGWDLSIWETVNWGTPLDVARWLPDGKSMDDLASFLQTWLYFGLIASVASIMKSKIDPRDFVCQDEDGRSWITTACLPRCFIDWERAREELPPSSWETSFAAIKAYLDEANRINDLLESLIGYGRRREGYKNLQEIHFSVQLLMCTLHRASTALLRPGKSLSTSRIYGAQSGLLQKQMTKRGWCYFTSTPLSEKVTVELLAYILALGTSQTKEDHSMCDRILCVASCVDNSYKPKHLHPDCHCELISTPIEEIVAELSAGHIPVLTIDEGSDSSAAPTLGVRPSDAQIPYVALSHVWADGLGNPTGNAIFRCQLEDIHEVLHSQPSAVATNEQKVAFWLDTLCIPVQATHQALRDFSIQRMRDIYKNASAVLVVDPDLRALTVEASDAELLSRLLSCNWSSRLWTYQEAALPEKFIIRGSHCLFHYDMILHAYTKPTCPLTVSASLGQLSAEFCAENIPRNLPVVTEESDDGIQELLFRTTDRITSRSGDETICIASCLGLDPSPLLQVPSKDRMRVLLETFPNIPANVLFSVCDRIQQEGFRWAPSTFRASPATSVQQPIVTPTSAMRPMSYLHPDREGLVTFLPVILLPGLRLSSFRRDWRVYLDTGGGKLHRLSSWGSLRGRLSGLRDQERLALLLPFRGRVTTEAQVEGEYRGILIDIRGEAPEPSSLKLSTGTLSRANLIGVVGLLHLSRDDIEIDRVPVNGRLGPPKWWLIDAEPYPDHLNFPEP